MEAGSTTGLGRKKAVALETGDQTVQDRRMIISDPLTTDPTVWANFSGAKNNGVSAKTGKTTNAELWARRQAAVPRGVGSATTVFVDRAENAYVWDVEGKRYIDFGGGIGVLNTGHRNPRVMQRVMDQMQRFTHTAFQVNPYEAYIELAERINAKAPVKGPAKTIFFSTGAEAVENAVKIARVATGRTGVICFQGAFHGRTMMTMAMTGKVMPYKKGFGPFPGEVYHAPFPSAYKGITEEQSIKGIEQFFKCDIDPARVAAIVIEPVQGEGGFNVATPSFLKKLRELCDKHGILLIADEVQSGFARTGKLFAMEHSGVQPDLITMAKSLAGGFPLSGVVGRAEIMDAVETGGLGGTYAGFPVACAAALGVLDTIEEDGLLARSQGIGDKIRGKLEGLKASLPIIGDIRGLGGMMAVELNATQAETKAIAAKALEDGLIVLSCGPDGNVLRFLVPLTATDAVVDEGLAILERALRSAKTS